MLMKSQPIYALQITLAAQCVIVIAFLGVFLLVASLKAFTVIYSLVISYLFGASIFVISNAYYTFYAFWHCTQKSTLKEVANENSFHKAQLNLRFMNKGQKGKLILGAILFALAFRFVDMLQVSNNVMALFTGYILLIFSQSFVAKIVIDKIARRSTKSN